MTVMLFLDCVYGRTADDYKSLVPRGCKLLLGAKYAPLRPEFLKWREFALERRRNFHGVKQNSGVIGRY